MARQENDVTSKTEYDLLYIIMLRMSNALFCSINL